MSCITRRREFQEACAARDTAEEARRAALESTTRLREDLKRAQSTLRRLRKRPQVDAAVDALCDQLKV